MADPNGKKSFEERMEAMAMNLELLSHSVQAHDRQIGDLKDSIAKLVEVTNQDATAIRTLARIAEAHERRIADLGGGRG